MRKNAFFKQKLDYTVFAKGKKEKDLQLLESKKNLHLHQPLS
jgi:hypothetical protein